MRTGAVGTIGPFSPGARDEMCQERLALLRRPLIGLVALFVGLLGFLPLSSAIAGEADSGVASSCVSYTYDNDVVCTKADPVLALNGDTQRDAPIRSTLSASAARTLEQVTTPTTVQQFVATKSGSIADDVAFGCFKSFGGETRVLMADGSTKPISKTEPGDMVFAQDPETGEIGARKVTAAWVHDDDLVRLEIDGDIVRTTEDHPFWNDTDREWQRADQLDSGDLVLTADGRRVKVGVLLGSAGRGSAYNLTVEGLHTYHVLFGAEAVLVHNACKPVNLPGYKNVSIDLDHVKSGHVSGGSRVSASKTLFPSAWSDGELSSTIRSAYANGSHVASQGERLLVRGQANGFTIEMWVNKTTKTIETAYPVG